MTTFKLALKLSRHSIQFADIIYYIVKRDPLKQLFAFAGSRHALRKIAAGSTPNPQRRVLFLKLTSLPCGQHLDCGNQSPYYSLSKTSINQATGLWNPLIIILVRGNFLNGKKLV
jgi:hypothetical protein